MGARRAGADQRQAARPVLQILQGVRIRHRGIGMIDPLHDLPGSVRMPRDRRHVGPRGVQRLDTQSVIRGADKLLV
jgi:hypothetical protein